MPETTPPRPKPFCPHITNAQVVQLGMAGTFVPIGEADVSGAQDLGNLGNQLKRPASLGGGLDLSNVGRKLPVYQGSLGGQFNLVKDSKPEDLNFIPTAARVPCQGHACAYWCVRHEECKETCNKCKFETFLLALQTHHQSVVTSAQGAPVLAAASQDQLQETDDDQPSSDA